MADFAAKLSATFTEQQGALKRFLMRRLGNAALAEDLAQETWIRAVNADTAAVIQNPRAYLFRIAANLATDHQRHVGKGIEVPAAVEQLDKIGRAHVELQSLMRISYAVFCLKKKTKKHYHDVHTNN